MAFIQAATKYLWVKMEEGSENFLRRLYSNEFSVTSNYVQEITSVRTH